MSGSSRWSWNRGRIRSKDSAGSSSDESFAKRYSSNSSDHSHIIVAPWMLNFINTQLPVNHPDRKVKSLLKYYKYQQLKTYQRRFTMSSTILMICVVVLMILYDVFEHGDHGVKEKWRIDCRCAAPCAGTFNVSYDYKKQKHASEGGKVTTGPLSLDITPDQLVMELAALDDIRSVNVYGDIQRVPHGRECDVHHIPRSADRLRRRSCQH